jgi:hypothetical protein
VTGKKTFFLSLKKQSKAAFLNPDYSATRFLKKKISTTRNRGLSSFADLSQG